MTPLQIILLAVTIFMVVRQVVLVTTLVTTINKVGRVTILWSWWAHLVATVALVVGTVVSFTGVSS